MNSLVPINRIPLDILSLIPTHLSSHQDCLCASFVCLHWRRTFLPRGTLWSQLFLRHGEDYVKTFLERSQGSVLDITTIRDAPLNLLFPYAQQIRQLEFQYNYWDEVLTFAQVNSRQFPLLRTLGIRINGEARKQLKTLAAPSLPLFSGAANLKEFVLDSMEEPKALKYFIFPNLTTFKLSAPVMGMSEASHLFNFLKASPMLQTVKLQLNGGLITKRIPQEMVVTLPNVETFSLVIKDPVDQVYEPAAHILCLRARYTSLMHHKFVDDMDIKREIFPDSVSWKEIVCQYTKSPVEEVTLEVEDLDQPISFRECSLTFRSFDATVIRLGFRVIDSDIPTENWDYYVPFVEILSQAYRTIQGHPRLSHVKHFHMKGLADETGHLGTHEVTVMVKVFGDLLWSLGPLEELTIHGCDLELFLAPFIDPERFGSPERGFPLIKELMISEWVVDEHQWMDAIVELAESQHRLGRPFECMSVRTRGVPADMAERLREWVSVADCYEA